MKLLIITTCCNPSGGGFNTRVLGLAKTASEIAEVSLLSTSDPRDTQIKGVKFYHQLFHEGVRSKLKRLVNYYRTDFEKIRISEQPDIVQIEHPDLFGLASQFPKTPIVYDAHNIWWKFEEYNMPYGPTLKKIPFKKPLMRWLRKRAKQHELQAISKSSLVLTCSETDKAEIVRECPSVKGKIFYVPTCIDPSTYEPTPDKADGENIVLFMGSLAYYPNIDAVRIICEEIAPRVNAEFHIMGAGSIDIARPSNVKFLGWTWDVRPHINKAAVCIAPIRYGSGTRVKIIEYMAMGKATVATSKGAEGLEITHGKNIVIEDDMERFAGAVNRLLKDEKLRCELGAQARRLIEERYDWRLYCSQLKSIYETL